MKVSRYRTYWLHGSTKQGLDNWKKCGSESLPQRANDRTAPKQVKRVTAHNDSADNHREWAANLGDQATGRKISQWTHPHDEQGIETHDASTHLRRYAQLGKCNYRRPNAILRYTEEQ